MAKQESRTSLRALVPRVFGPTFWRLTRWGVAAVMAVSLAFLVASSDLGLQRMAAAFSQVQGLPPPAPVQVRDNGEIVRLSKRCGGSRTIVTACWPASTRLNVILTI